MKLCIATLIALGSLFTLTNVGNATIIGFGQVGGSNAAIPADLASNAVADGAGFTVSNGATPNVSLAWDASWDIHTSSHFDALEGLTGGGNPWDTESPTDGPRIAQIEDLPQITFSVDPGYALVLNSFDFGNTREVADIGVWDVVLTDASSNIAWSTQVTLDNNSGDDLVTIAPGFTGELGASYTLTLEQNGTSAIGPQHGIDNLSFNQIPEPTAIALLALGTLTVGRRR